MRLLALAIAVALLAGCGDDAGDPPAGGGGGAETLEIRFDDGRGETRAASLTCSDGEASATGYLADGDAAALCAAAGELAGLLTEPPPATQACTEIYGGQQTARVTGSLDGAAVDRELSRVNGCRIAEWDRMAAAGLLPAGGA